MLLNMRKNSSLEVEESQPLITTNDVLLNPFSNKRATPEQQHHLLHFRQMGSVEFAKNLEYFNKPVFMFRTERNTYLHSVIKE